MIWIQNYLLCFILLVYVQQFDGEQDLEKKESEDEEDMLTWSHYQFFKFILSVLYLNNFKR